MKKTRIVGRVVAGALASALLLTGLAAPAEARDSGWGTTGIKSNNSAPTLRDSGWGTT